MVVSVEPGREFLRRPEALARRHWRPHTLRCVFHLSRWRMSEYVVEVIQIAPQVLISECIVEHAEMCENTSCAERH